MRPARRRGPSPRQPSAPDGIRSAFSLTSLFIHHGTSCDFSDGDCGSRCIRHGPATVFLCGESAGLYSSGEIIFGHCSIARLHTCWRRCVGMAAAETPTIADDRGREHVRRCAWRDELARVRDAGGRGFPAAGPPRAGDGWRRCRRWRGSRSFQEQREGSLSNASNGKAAALGRFGRTGASKAVSLDSRCGCRCQSGTVPGNFVPRLRQPSPHAHPSNSRQFSSSVPRAIGSPGR